MGHQRGRRRGRVRGPDVLRGQARGERRGVTVMHRALGHQGRPDRRARDRFGGTESLPAMTVRGTESPRRRARMA